MLGGERVGVMEGVVRKHENKTRLYISIIDEYITAYQSFFDSNKLMSVYNRVKYPPV